MEEKSAIKDILNMNVKRSEIVYKHMQDPALLRYYYRLKMLPITDKLNIQGSSPTDIFIGRYNYPNVFIGPMLPPIFGDTSILATPERWRDFSIERIVSARSQLVRGTYLSKAKNVEKGRIEEQIRDLALSDKPSDAQLDFKHKPYVRLSLNDDVQPFGPSAQIQQFRLYNTRTNKQLQKKYADTDATAKDAVIELYNNGMPISKIQQGFSAGLFGIISKRKFVPTRWSITAVDDTIGKNNLEIVKGFNELDCIYAFFHVALDNRWLIFFIPGKWAYESAEAWYPKTIWNQDESYVSIYSSYEGYNGRKEYAEIGGCYYAAKLAVTEKLREMKAQGKVIILREVHPGYIMPVGVWNVREHVRETLQTTPVVLNTRGEMFEYIKDKLEIKLKDWVNNCTLLKHLAYQRGINDYIAKN